MGYFNVGKSSNITYIDTAVNIGYAVKVELYGIWSKLAFVWKYNAWNDDIIFVYLIYLKALRCDTKILDKWILIITEVK